MYFVKLGNANNRMLLGIGNTKTTIIEAIVPHVDIQEGTPQLSEIDMSQSGSGMKGLRNKMKQLDLHSKAKKKYNKFISLNL